MSAPQLHTEHTVHLCDVTLTRYELCGKWGNRIEGIEVLKNASILEREILVTQKNKFKRFKLINRKNITDSTNLYSNFKSFILGLCS